MFSWYCSSRQSSYNCATFCGDSIAPDISLETESTCPEAAPQLSWGDRCRLLCLRSLHVAHHAPASGGFCACDGQDAGAGRVLAFSVRNSVDAGSRGNSEYRRSRPGFLAPECGPQRIGSALGVEQATTGGARFRQLHLTSVSAGGSCPQQTLRAIRKPRCVPRGLHHRGTSQRRVADAEQ